MSSWIRAKVYLVHTPDPSVAKSSILDFNSNNFDLSVSVKLVTKQKIKRGAKSRTFQKSGERAGEAISGCVSQGAAQAGWAQHSTMCVVSQGHPLILFSCLARDNGLGNWALVLPNGSV